MIRFCKSLGYSGYSQFRLALAQELAASPTPLPLPLKTGENPAQIARNVFDFSIRTLQNTAAITSYRTSPLAQLVDYPLVAYADDTAYPVEAVSARLAHLCLLDVLATGLALRGGTAAAKRLAQKNQILENLRRKTRS